jgi:hypothetical protein
MDEEITVSPFCACFVEKQKTSVERQNGCLSYTVL